MGYIFDFQDVLAYHEWCNQPENHAAIQRETWLIHSMLEPVKGRSLLDIGCGTGMLLQFFLQQGLMVSGIDPSPYMLDMASNILGNRADLHRGQAEDLPFDDNAFHYVCMIKTLEYVDDPRKAISEACRVAKDRVYIGITSRRVAKKIERQCKGEMSNSFFEKAYFFSVWEVKEIVRRLLGDVPMTWRSLNEFSMAPGILARRLEQSCLLQKCPFGDFTGILITPIPRYKTRPLSITYAANPRHGSVVG